MKIKIETEEENSFLIHDVEIVKSKNITNIKINAGKEDILLRRKAQCR